MFCTNCGSQIDDNSTYCDYCGNKTSIEDKIKETIEDIERKKDIGDIERKKDTGDIERKKDIGDIEGRKKTVENRTFKDLNITFIGLCIILLTIGLVASIINTINIYIVGKGTNYIFGQAIFGLVFTTSTVLLRKSKKIGGAILIPFMLFKTISSIYYYLKTYHIYFIENLIIDEVFYLAIISSVVIYWKNLK